VIIFRAVATLAGLSLWWPWCYGVGALGAVAARSGRPYRQVAARPSNVVLETVVDADRRIRIVGDLAGELIHLGQSVLHAWDTIDRFINTTFAVPDSH
jgi:hypothetical protein